MRYAFLILTVLMIPTQSAAQSICRTYEYAELKDMPPAQLAALYCRYNEAMSSMFSAALSNMQAGYTGASQRDMNDSHRCLQELGRIEQALKAAHSAPKPTC